MRFVVVVALMLLSTQMVSAKEKAQVLDFEAMDIKTSKGSPKGAYISSKKDKDFDYFFEAKMDFKSKVIESLGSVR